MSLSAYERHECEMVLLQLAAARGRKLSADDCAGCISLLDDMGATALREALQWSARHDRYFPDVPKIRGAAREARSALGPVSPDVAAALDAGEIACRVCEDTGWQWVEKATERPCGRPPVGSHATYRVRPCGCRPTNLLYQAKQVNRPRQRAFCEE